MSPLGINGLIIGWALIMEYAIGIWWPYLEWLFYWTIGQWRNPLAAMGSNGLLDSLHWIQRCNCLNAGGKQYENLRGTKTVLYRLDYVASNRFFPFCSWFTALFIIILITALVYRGMKEPETPVTWWLS
jgi:hypothetical protein